MASFEESVTILHDSLGESEVEFLGGEVPERGFHTISPPVMNYYLNRDDDWNPYTAYSEQLAQPVEPPVDAELREALTPPLRTAVEQRMINRFYSNPLGCFPDWLKPAIVQDTGTPASSSQAFL